MINKEILERFHVEPGTRVKLKDHETGWQQSEELKRLGKAAAKGRAQEVLAENLADLAEAQELLWASDNHSVLVVLQAMDAAGKDGTIKHVVTGVNPQGVHVTGFKRPSDEALDHNFLWRYANAAPSRGTIGIFNRSYYEEVLVVKVHPAILDSQKLPEGKRGKKFWEARYDIGSSDMWDQAQPRTVSYTVDILLNGGKHWILPVEAGSIPATKPPLYNWLAVPAVAVLGFSSDLGHKLPSVVSACLLWLLVVRLGRWLDPVAGGGVGWLAAAMLAASYFWAKLAYLARPDMLLTLLLTVGWVAATAVVVDDRGAEGRRSRRRMAVVFWVATALATLAKGPPAIVLPVYALIAARWIRGRWRDTNGLGWWWSHDARARGRGRWWLGRSAGPRSVSRAT